MKCEGCGYQLADDAAFCPSCGAKTLVTEVSTVGMEATPMEIDTVPMEQQAPPEDPLLKAVRLALANDYDVERELGRGGMAVVFDAMERDLQRRVAIKVLPPETASGDAAERFKREARLAAQLDHPNIIPVFRVGQADSLQYIAMKFVEGKGLDELVKEQGALPINVVLRLLTDSARALAFAHDRGVIHRDIKGANILIEQDGRVLVADFGIARAAGEHTITATGMVVGTPSFMSPEQCGGLTLGPQSDQYSLGVLAFQLLTGSLPFEADSLVTLVQHHYTTPPPDIKGVRQDVPEELLSIVYRALQKKPEQRFKTTKHMVAALEAVPQTDEERQEADRLIQQLVTGEEITKVDVDDLPPLTTPMATALGQQAVQQKRRAPLVFALIAVIVILGGGGIAWQTGMLGGGEEEQSPGAAQLELVALAFNGKPSDARIELDDEQLDGTFKDVEPGVHHFMVTSDSFVTLFDTIQVDSDTIVELRERLQLKPELAAAAERPTQPQVTETGSLMVAVYNATDSSLVQTPRIELDGARELTNRESAQNVPVGNRLIRASASGCTPKDTTVAVTADTRKTVRIYLACQG